MRAFPLHLFRVDAATRYALVLVGAFASYALGANNIANVMGVFVPSAPFGELDVFGWFRLNPAQQLFLIGGIAIAVGVFTYSRRTMLTVGSRIFRLSPISALIVVLAQALVLFLFSSEALERWLSSRGLPAFPLVPVSSSQAVVGAVLGIGLAKGGRNIRWGVLGRIASGWVATPALSAVIALLLLFFVQNVFSQRVCAPNRPSLSTRIAVGREPAPPASPGSSSAAAPSPHRLGPALDVAGGSPTVSPRLRLESSGTVGGSGRWRQDGASSSGSSTPGASRSWVSRRGPSASGG
jgi:hypothetical protein